MYKYCFMATARYSIRINSREKRKEKREKRKGKENAHLVPRYLVDSGTFCNERKLSIFTKKVILNLAGKLL